MIMNCCLPQGPPWTAGGFLLLLLLLAGCAQNQPLPEMKAGQEPVQGTECEDAAGEPPRPPHNLQQKEDSRATCSLPVPVVANPAGKHRSTQECYHPLLTAAKKTSPSKKKKKKIKQWGRCEPQSLPFARCRSGISSCGLGWNNGPLTWFACEKQYNNTSLVPSAGSILILGANKRNHMPTGHVAYVERVTAEKGANYRIIFSHTNYDRRCSLETNIEAEYNSSTRTLNILTGAWKDWGKGLPVAGFILR